VRPAELRFRHPGPLGFRRRWSGLMTQSRSPKLGTAPIPTLQWTASVPVLKAVDLSFALLAGPSDVPGVAFPVSNRELNWLKAGNQSRPAHGQDDKFA
jgi:hypothetical protein